MTQPTALNYITCHFGERGSWMAGYHTGIDYRAPVGTKIHATRGGKVLFAGSGGSYGSAYGSYVVIHSLHRGRGVQHLYAHLSKPVVRIGQQVKTGQLIGYSGATGNVFGPHLHYEEREYPYNYWAHRKPVFPTLVPLNKKFVRAVRRRLGLEK